MGRREAIAEREERINQLLDKLSFPDPDEEGETDPEMLRSYMRIALANVARQRLRDHVRMGEWMHPPLPEYDDQQVKHG